MVCDLGTTAPGLAWSTREPLNMRGNPLIRTSTSRYAHGRRCPGTHERARVRAGARPPRKPPRRRPTAGPRARGCTRVSRPAVRRRRIGPACAASTHPRSSFACNSTERTFNSVYKRCNSNDANVRRDTGARELHAKSLDSPPNGSQAMPPTRPGTGAARAALVPQSLVPQQSRT